MSLDLLNLPTDKTSLALTIEHHAMTAERNAAPLWAKWSLFEAYLRGYRVFEGYDVKGGKVDSFVLDKDGKLPLQFQEVLVNINRVAGLLSSVDPSPFVSRVGDSIGSIRDRANAQVILDSAFSAEHNDEVHDQFVDAMCLYGTAGLFGDVFDDPILGLGGHKEVVYPYELFPFPVTSRPGRVRAIQRTRVVSLEYLKKRFGDSRVARHIKDMHVYVRPIYDATHDVFDSQSPRIFGDTKFRQPNPVNPAITSQHKVTEHAVQLREVFVYGPMGRMIRYVAQSKNYILQDVDYTKEAVLAFVPIGIGRFFSSGSFYGMGYMDVLFSITRVVERMLKEVENAVHDLRRYPVTLIPSGTVNERKVFKEDGYDGMRFATYTPERSFSLGPQQIRPITIAPKMDNPEQGARTASFFMEMVTRHSMTGDLARDKGRIDSLPALQFLDEVTRQPMTKPIAGLQRAYGPVYRAMSAALNLHAMKSDRAIPVSNLNLDLAGAIIDFEKGTVKLTSKAVPDVTRLKFGMKGSSTSSPSLKKQEAYMNHEKGRLTNEELRVYLMEEGIEVGMYTRGDRGAVQRVVEDLLRLYNDGEQPNMTRPVLPSPDTSRPHIQLVIVDAFLAGVEVQRASEPVRTALYSYRQALQALMGNVLPEGIPDVQGQALSGGDPQLRMVQ